MILVPKVTQEPQDIKVKMASQVYQVLQDRWATQDWREREGRRAVQVTLALRGLQDRGAERVQWGLEERTVFQGLERKEKKDLQEILVALDLLELLGLWGPKVQLENMELQAVQVLLV